MSLLFDDEVKIAFQVAEDEARQHYCNYISTEHLLLGLTHGNPPNRAIQVLDLHFNISPGELQKQLLLSMGLPGNNYNPSKPVTLTRNGQAVLDLAAEEAISSGQQEVRAEHLLIGLLRQESGLAARTLRDMGVDLAHCRVALDHYGAT